jgi:hypothetical protein
LCQRLTTLVNHKSPGRDESRPCSMSGQSKHFQTRPFFTMRVATQPFPLVCPTGSAATLAGFPGPCRLCHRSREVQVFSRNELSASAWSIIRSGGTDRSADVKPALRLSVELYPEAAYNSLTMNSTDTHCLCHLAGCSHHAACGTAQSRSSRKLRPFSRITYYLQTTH